MKREALSKLEHDIDQESNRITIRQSVIQSELDELNSKVQKFTGWAWAFVWIGFAVLLFSVGYYLGNPAPDFGLNLLGDFLAGSVASIWSLAGLFFIYVAFLGQKQQLLNQQLEIMFSQIEVKYTRLELEGQKNEMIEQNQTLRKQRFENTFFQLLTLHHQIVNGMDVRSSGGPVIKQGRDVFRSRYNSLKGKIHHLNLDETAAEYLKLYKAWQLDFGHYFRNLYHIIKFVHNSELSDTEKYKYVTLVRAQLSTHELLLIFYNCISSNGVEKFKPLIEHYHLFKNLPVDELASTKHRAFYEEPAYKKVRNRNTA